MINTRIHGIDLARALALIGMMTAHFGAPYGFHNGFWGNIGAATHGRSSILFAVLAGVSIAIMTGRTSPVDGEDLVAARIKLVLRALIILTIGSGLVTYNTGIDIILPTYALLFFIAIAFLRASRRTLIFWSLGFATIGTAVHYLWAPFAYTDKIPLPFQSFFTPGNYALIPWVSLVLAGMAIGRTDLTQIHNAVNIACLGAALAIFGYGTSIIWGTFGPFPAADPTEFGRSKSGSDESSFTVSDGKSGLTEGDWGADAPMLMDESTTDYVHEIKESFRRYLLADDHSGSITEMIAGIGVAMLVIGLCLLIARNRFKVLVPLLSMGAMPLSLYTAHVLSFKHLAHNSSGFNVDMWALSLLAAAVFATVWLTFFKRGPLEWFIAWAIRRFLTPPSTDAYLESINTPDGALTTREFAQEKNASSKAPDQKL